ncbi:FtsX-like permease family protein [Exilibacterium tricleocarpae]|uniref:FtsX-like permease family protein n=1 Tax=Exilibacterium tricleocarpae TaxID=2591008 RepID=A0A545U5B4_9GAMM|nr:ABC transporter permease [Exilibacterium tricleocarpae]TQV84654.1 FtsX-like permease family protein [Exilibacterium tricleocarpae]
MFNWISQLVVMSLMNLGNIRQRLGASSVAVFGVAGVVGVFVAVLSMAAGFEKTMLSATADDVALVMRSGATAELNSGLGYDQTQLIADAPGILREDGRAITSAELFVIVDIPKRATNTSANVPLRGVQPGAFAVRENVKIIEGRNFEPGRHELIVGKGAQAQFANLEVGSTVTFGQLDWQVVGVFEAGGGVNESELWCDVRVLQPAYRRGNSFQSVRVKLADTDALPTLKRALAANPQLDVDIKLESEYSAEQSEPLSKFIRVLGYPLAVLMSLGAVFGAINTMYASVSARTREIATLRALGFGAVPVAISTLIESLILALIGGGLGAAAVYVIFNGYTVSTINGASFSQVVFDFAVTGELVVQGVMVAMLIGLLGGLLPAVRAARMPVALALRET